MQYHHQEKKKPGSWARLLALLAALVLCLTALYPGRALAEGEDTEAMVRSYDAGKWGSLTLRLSYTKEEKADAIPLDGAQIRIVRIADLQMTDKGPTYPLREGLDKLHYDFLSLSAGGLRQAAKEIADYLKAHPEVFTTLEKETNPQVSPKPDGSTPKGVRTATSDSQGKVFFDHLVHGIYLITQEGQTGTAKDFVPLAPILCFMPEYLNAEGKGTWIYDVVANPKYSPKKPPTPVPPPDNPPPEKPPTPNTPSEKPKTPSTPVPKPPSTGDMIHMGLWIGMGLVALIVLLVVLRKNKKK